jgi:uncharacterized protein YjbI with pentapeptide repeats
MSTPISSAGTAGTGGFTPSPEPPPFGLPPSGPPLSGPPSASLLLSRPLSLREQVLVLIGHLHPNVQQFEALHDIAAWIVVVEFIRFADRSMRDEGTLELDRPPRFLSTARAALAIANVFKSPSRLDERHRQYKYIARELHRLAAERSGSYMARLRATQHPAACFDFRAPLRDWPRDVLRVALSTSPLSGDLSVQVCRDERFFAGYDLTRRNLARCIFDGMDLNGVPMRWCVANGACLSGATLIGADLTGSHIEGALFNGQQLSNAILAEVNGSHAQCRGALMAGANLSGAYMSAAVIERADLAGAVLDGANFRFAAAARARLVNVSMRSAIFRGACLDYADLSGSDLTGADFEGASLVGASLCGVRLRGAKFTGARLSGTRISLDPDALRRLDVRAQRYRDLGQVGYPDGPNHPNHPNRARQSILSAIDSIAEDYRPLKNQLMVAVIDALLPVPDLDDCAASLRAVLCSDPGYAQDDTIREFMQDRLGLAPVAAD